MEISDPVFNVVFLGLGSNEGCMSGFIEGFLFGFTEGFLSGFIAGFLFGSIYRYVKSPSVSWDGWFDGDISSVCSHAEHTLVRPRAVEFFIVHALQNHSSSGINSMSGLTSGRHFRQMLHTVVFLSKTV